MDYARGLARGGHFAHLASLPEKLRNEYFENLGERMVGIFEEGNAEALDWLRQKDLSGVDWQKLLVAAASSGHPDLIEFCFEHGAELRVNHITSLFQFHIAHGNDELLIRTLQHCERLLPKETTGHLISAGWYRLPTAVIAYCLDRELLQQSAIFKECFAHDRLDILRLIPPSERKTWRFLDLYAKNNGTHDQGKLTAKGNMGGWSTPLPFSFKTARWVLKNMPSAPQFDEAFVLEVASSPDFPIPLFDFLYSIGVPLGNRSALLAMTRHRRRQTLQLLYKNGFRIPPQQLPDIVRVLYTTGEETYRNNFAQTLVSLVSEEEWRQAGLLKPDEIGPMYVGCLSLFRAF